MDFTGPQSTDIPTCEPLNSTSRRVSDTSKEKRRVEVPFAYPIGPLEAYKATRSSYPAVSISDTTTADTPTATQAVTGTTTKGSQKVLPCVTSTLFVQESGLDTMQSTLGMVLEETSPMNHQIPRKKKYKEVVYVEETKEDSYKPRTPPVQTSTTHEIREESNFLQATSSSSFSASSASVVEESSDEVSDRKMSLALDQYHSGVYSDALLLEEATSTVKIYKYAFQSMTDIRMIQSRFYCVISGNQGHIFWDERPIETETDICHKATVQIFTNGKFITFYLYVREDTGRPTKSIEFVYESGDERRFAFFVDFLRQQVADIDSVGPKARYGLTGYWSTDDGIFSETEEDDEEFCMHCHQYDCIPDDEMFKDVFKNILDVDHEAIKSAMAEVLIQYCDCPRIMEVLFMKYKSQMEDSLLKLLSSASTERPSIELCELGLELMLRIMESNKEIVFPVIVQIETLVSEISVHFEAMKGGAQNFERISHLQSAQSVVKCLEPYKKKIASLQGRKVMTSQAA